MEKDYTQSLLQEMKEIKAVNSNKIHRLIDLELLERIHSRLNSFNDECEECKTYIIIFEEYIKRLHQKFTNLNKTDLKEHQKNVNPIIIHLQKSHKLVNEGHYMGTFMSLGMSIGLIFGMLIFNNIALGLPIGMVIGMAMGSNMDKDAKKKGLTI